MELLNKLKLHALKINDFILRRFCSTYFLSNEETSLKVPVLFSTHFFSQIQVANYLVRPKLPFRRDD